MTNEIKTCPEWTDEKVDLDGKLYPPACVKNARDKNGEPVDYCGSAACKLTKKGGCWIVLKVEGQKGA